MNQDDGSFSGVADTILDSQSLRHRLNPADDKIFVFKVHMGFIYGFRKGPRLQTTKSCK